MPRKRTKVYRGGVQTSMKLSETTELQVILGQNWKTGQIRNTQKRMVNQA